MWWLFEDSDKVKYLVEANTRGEAIPLWKAKWPPKDDMWWVNHGRVYPLQHLNITNRLGVIRPKLVVLLIDTYSCEYKEHKMTDDWTLETVLEVVPGCLEIFRQMVRHSINECRWLDAIVLNLSDEEEASVFKQLDREWRRHQSCNRPERDQVKAWIAKYDIDLFEEAEMTKLGWKWWDEFKQKYVVVECGILVGDTIEITNADIMPLGHYADTHVNWWAPEYPEGGMVLMD